MTANHLYKRIRCVFVLRVTLIINVQLKHKLNASLKLLTHLSTKDAKKEKTRLIICTQFQALTLVSHLILQKHLTSNSN